MEIYEEHANEKASDDDYKKNMTDHRMHIAREKHFPSGFRFVRLGPLFLGRQNSRCESQLRTENTQKKTFC